MSEKNNNKQTLFRFVSLRNPNLAETETKNLKFIHRQDGLKGVFDQATTAGSQTKLQALLQVAATFSTSAIKSVEDLERGTFRALIPIGKSISNQTNLSEEELAVCKNTYTNSIGSKTSDGLRTIWDNFIYQYLTQKDFYVKEALAYILKALHVGYAQTLKPDDELKRLNGEDFVKTATEAIIVIPATLLGSETVVNPKSADSKAELTDKDTSLLTLDAEKLETQQNALSENENLEQLKAELKDIKDSYWSEYENAYKAARDTYENEHGANVQAYADQIELIDELIEDDAPKEEIEKAKAELSKYNYPEFEFSYKEELNWDDVYNQLSEDALAYFLDHFAKAQQKVTKDVNLTKSKVNVTDSKSLTIDTNTFTFTHNSYDAIIADIDNQTATNTTTILTETNITQNEYVNVGGVVVPVATPTNQTPHLSYVLRARKIGWFGVNRGYVMFQIRVENASWSVSNAVISATTSTGTHAENISNVAVVNNKINFPTFLRNKIQGITNLSIQIFFSNGRETTLQLSSIAINRAYTGILKLKPIDSIDPIDPNPSEPSPTSGKHFGLKRLGVAEYMKVTQSVHAYVPGEVSNIENVMASELRHKSINELTRTEDTVTTSTSQEVEKISDTTKVNRAEMQTEVAKEIDKQRDFQAHANYSRDTKVMKFDAGVAYASANAQHTSNRQAVTKSKEITERAMERVQSKISEERISKIIQEVSLTNVHEYDNRGGLGENAERPKHITGVYRWVDKKMKNQIYNYGKRTMFEFMIPEPAKLHRLAIATSEHTLTAPVDPRKAPAPHKMSNATTTTTTLLQYWADKYGVQLTTAPQNKQETHNVIGAPHNKHNFFTDNDVTISEDYVAKSAQLEWNCVKEQYRRSGWFGGLRPGSCNFSNFKGNFVHGSMPNGSRAASGSQYINGLNLTGTINYEVKGYNVKNFNATLKLNLEPSTASVNAWKLENFNAIIEAYQTALDAHNEEVARIEAEQAAKQADQKDVMGNFYRIIEGDILKHNCVAYLLQNYLTTLGQDFTDGDKMQNFRVNLGEDLDRYTAKAKFLEQAFEWSIMDYTFYPYFWADRRDWQEMYLSENTDTLFRSFLQAGMARVIVIVKPGFEEAVQYFLETGKVWLGGETPVIGDPLYMSIAQEMREPTGVPQGNYWITRIPTTLTILQAKSAGLEVTQALPIFPENEPENCENPEQLETETAFSLDDAQLTSPGTGETTLYSN